MMATFFQHLLWKAIVFATYFKPKFSQYNIS